MYGENSSVRVNTLLTIGEFITVVRLDWRRVAMTSRMEGVHLVPFVEHTVGWLLSSIIHSLVTQTCSFSSVALALSKLNELNE